VVTEREPEHGTPRLAALVLGLGGNVSQGILKALRLSALPVRIVGACISASSPGLYAADTALLSPSASDAGFVDWVQDVCIREGIQVVFSGAEPVINALAVARDALEEGTGARIVVSSPEILAIGDDKLLTSEWLRHRGLNYPRCVLGSDADGIEMLLATRGFPLIAKPRHGKGGRGVVVVSTPDELGIVPHSSDYVLQEYLGRPEDEFTVGCWSDRDGLVRGSIVMRRELTNGTSTAIVVEESPVIRDEAEKIAAALKPMGPCNVQLRMHEGRAVCFEINVRYSGTTPIRAKLGFNDVEASLRHYVLGAPAVDLPVVNSGRALRVWREVYPDVEAMDHLAAVGVLDVPTDFTSVDDGWPPS
jgi:carbamoyl-phosphate synthase large subunit